jgi:hypothetical protein
MLKKDLATALRQRQYKKGLVKRKLIDALSDDQIIDCYITCSCCGEKQVDNPLQLAEIIAKSKNVDEFFAFCDAAADAKLQVLESAQEIVDGKKF